MFKSPSGRMCKLLYDPTSYSTAPIKWADERKITGLRVLEAYIPHPDSVCTNYIMRFDISYFQGNTRISHHNIIYTDLCSKWYINYPCGAVSCCLPSLVRNTIAGVICDVFNDNDGVKAEVYAIESPIDRRTSHSNAITITILSSIFMNNLYYIQFKVEYDIYVPRVFDIITDFDTKWNVYRFYQDAIAVENFIGPGKVDDFTIDSITRFKDIIIERSYNMMENQ